MELEFSRQVFEKCSIIKFHGNWSIGSRVVSCGQKYRHDKANSCFMQILRTRLKMNCFIPLFPLRHGVDMRKFTVYTSYII